MVGARNAPCGRHRFDAHRRDPMGLGSLHAADYRALTDALCAAADVHCGGRVVSVLEGGCVVAPSWLHRGSIVAA